LRYNFIEEDKILKGGKIKYQQNKITGVIARIVFKKAKASDLMPMATASDLLRAAKAQEKQVPDLHI